MSETYEEGGKATQEVIFVLRSLLLLPSGWHISCSLVRFSMLVRLDSKCEGNLGNWNSFAKKYSFGFENVE